jgi:hypothetical protein
MVNDVDRAVWAAQFGQRLSAVATAKGISDSIAPAQNPNAVPPLAPRVVASRRAVQATHRADPLPAEHRRDDAILAWLAFRPEKLRWNDFVGLSRSEDHSDSVKNYSTGVLDCVFAGLNSGSATRSLFQAGR